MTFSGTRFLDSIAEQGIPAKWGQFGAQMSADGAIVTHLVAAVKEAHETGSSEARDAALRLFDEKRDNLAAARQLIATQLTDYRESGRWARLDAVVRSADVDELVEGMRGHFGLHPFPIALESIRFNFEYVREHGFEEFYHMTDQYLAEIERLTEEGRAAFEAGEDGESFPPFWLYKLDMASVEVPTHCHICQNLITYAERALDES
ncbi:MULTISPECIES: hypothetical protein [unclassified Actinopolyspora]|uniref:hypothetical protein n=1 Tax=unclassified Actinopolyspora TaxID=2639451 RepID=UPI0013F69549|nr:MULTISPECIES: hypothetical protein [unclassified Actinopolyspora]NHD18087.1 hypothetical protein [Actinopolyspora sp. BKK2]NHE78590.1 hypothetical protein [Actinopolyspora sp. BKK1]